MTNAAVIYPLLLGFGWKYHWPLHTLLPLVMLLTAAAFLTPFRLRKPSLPTAKDLPIIVEQEDDDPDRLAEAK